MRMIIELKRDAQPMKVLNNLFKHTALQRVFGVNMLALVERGTQPRVLTLKRALQEYISHRQEVITRRTEFELERARRRAHILEGLKIALDNIDAVIATIRASRTTETARNNLMSSFKLTEVQATAILDMRLARLAALERKKIEDEYKEVLAEIKRLEALLADPKLILGLIRDDMARSEGEVWRRAPHPDPGHLRRPLRRRPDPRSRRAGHADQRAATSSAAPTTSTAPSTAAAAASPA